MQAICGQCSQKIAIDDAKVPERPFSVKCPKCQNVIKLPGREAAAPAEVLAPPVPEPPPARAAEASAPGEQAPPPVAAVAPAAGGGALPGERALVALTDRAQAAAVTATLGRLGYPTDTVPEGSDAARLLEQGVYAVVVTTRGFSAQGQSETLYQHVMRLSPANRRRVFAVLLGDEFRSGDGAQAFVILADLVLNPRDAATADNVIRGTLAERRRVYQVFLEARDRFEAAAS